MKIGFEFIYVPGATDVPPEVSGNAPETLIRQYSPRIVRNIVTTLKLMPLTTSGSVAFHLGVAYWHRSGNWVRVNLELDDPYAETTHPR